MDAIDLAGLRREYETQGLRRADLHHDPIEQFATWFSTAVNSALPDANAISLATATPEGKALGADCSPEGFRSARFCFFHQLPKQKRARAGGESAGRFFTFTGCNWSGRSASPGGSRKLRGKNREAYFHGRPRGSQLGAWVSHQSEVIDARRILDARLAEMTERFAGQDDIELPPHWGGYRIVPATIEFWQGRANRLHDRFRYTRQADDSWTIDRLAP